MKAKVLVFVFTVWTILSFVFPVASQAQDNQRVPVDVSGQWIGVATQNEGGYRSEYNLQVYLVQDGDSLSGRSYVNIEDAKIYVDMEIKGSIHSGMLIRLDDIRMIDYKVRDGMEWCDKRYQLVLKREEDDWVIEGYWQGDTNFSACVPGRIFLRKTSPRA